MYLGAANYIFHFATQANVGLKIFVGVARY